MKLSLNVRNWEDAQLFYEELRALGKKPQFTEKKDVIFWEVKALED